jgi:hypothetical protein
VLVVNKKENWLVKKYFFTLFVADAMLDLALDLIALVPIK